MLPTFSIVIVNWRSKDYLRGCLRAVRDTCADLSPQIVVVDGASFDGCGEMLAEEFPEVRFIQSRENIGFGQCSNLGFAQTTRDAVLLLNPDTEVRPGAVRLLLEELAARSGVALLAPRLLNSDGSLQTSCVQAFPTPWNQALDSDLLRRLFPRSRLWGVGEAFAASDPVEVEAVSGACMLLPSEVFRRIGGFSPEYFMYGEDMDLCLQLRRAGLKVLHVPASKVVHHGSGSARQQVSYFSTVLIRDTTAIYMRRNYGPATAAWYRLLQGLSALTRILLAAVPASLLPGGSLGTAARNSVKKSKYVLQWTLGMNPVGAKSAMRPAARNAPPASSPAAPMH